MSASINLLQQKLGPTREVAELEDKLRVAAVWALGAMVLCGVAIGSTYAYFSSSLASLQAEKARVARLINEQSNKEGILLSLKDRTGIAAKALDAAKPWGDLFPLLTQISGGGYKNVSVDEIGRVNAELSANSIDDAVNVVSNVLALADDRVIRSPKLNMFLIGDEGQIRYVISFVPVF